MCIPERRHVWCVSEVAADLFAPQPFPAPDLQTPGGAVITSAVCAVNERLDSKTGVAQCGRAVDSPPPKIDRRRRRAATRPTTRAHSELSQDGRIGCRGSKRVYKATRQASDAFRKSQTAGVEEWMGWLLWAMGETRYKVRRVVRVCRECWLVAAASRDAGPAQSLVLRGRSSSMAIALFRGGPAFTSSTRIAQLLPIRLDDIQAHACHLSDSASSYRASTG